MVTADQFAPGVSTVRRAVGFCLLGVYTVTMGTGTDDEPDESASDDRSVDGEHGRRIDGPVAESGQAEAREDEEEWRFSLDDLPSTGDEDDESASNIAGTLETRQPLEPGDIDLENAFFVALGILIVIALIAGAMFGF
jgi:hypothetical protein